ncbi:hypothetical protein BDQ17DRAFT_327221 [Cyathus striatus]|nr:hypothetical protein BDQ17DRAFT_327221 [Cyathus striatus]
MDKPMGPRGQPPDKRHAAYESIFGRPGVAHHQSPLPPANYPQYIPQQPPPPPAIYYQQQPYPPGGDRRTSYSSSTYAPSAHGHAPYPTQQPQGASSIYRQSPFPNHPQHHLSQSTYSQSHSHSSHPYTPSLAPPSLPSRTRSILSNSNSSGVIVPQPKEPPDTIHPGLTPAQAYQAQVYQNNPPPPPDRTPYRTPTALSDRNSYPQSQNGLSGRPHDPPRLGISLERDDGRLGIDFGANSGSSSDQGTDEGSTELPWARHDRTVTASTKHHSNHHERQPSMSETAVSVSLFHQLLLINP